MTRGSSAGSVRLRALIKQIPIVGLAALTVITTTAGCEGRAQKEAIRQRIGTTAEGRSLPALENYYAAAVADKDNAWAVGSYGTILKVTDNGSKVTPQASGTQVALLSASAATSADVVVGGENATILHTTD